VASLLERMRSSAGHCSVAPRRSRARLRWFEPRLDQPELHFPVGGCGRPASVSRFTPSGIVATTAILPCWRSDDAQLAILAGWCVTAAPRVAQHEHHRRNFSLAPTISFAVPARSRVGPNAALKYRRGRARLRAYEYLLGWARGDHIPSVGFYFIELGIGKKEPSSRRLLIAGRDRPGQIPGTGWLRLL